MPDDHNARWDSPGNFTVTDAPRGGDTLRDQTGSTYRLPADPTEVGDGRLWARVQELGGQYDGAEWAAYLRPRRDRTG